jgi:hypothetical protein
MITAVTNLTMRVNIATMAREVLKQSIDRLILGSFYDEDLSLFQNTYIPTP